MPKKSQTKEAAVTPLPLERRIHEIRKCRVILDSDLAELYQVETSNLNKAVKRNAERFPKDFMFRLTKREWESLTFQFGISNEGRGGRRTPPYVFTEHGVAMLSSVLNSPRAVQMNILIMRTFMKLREVMASHQELATKVEALERKYEHHEGELKTVFHAIKRLLGQPAPAPQEEPRRRIGFRTEASAASSRATS